LHLALDAIGLKAGDEVVLPTTTFTATAEVVRYFDAKPVLVDVRADTMCIDPHAIDAAITKHTRAIIPVHFAGHPAEMDTIMECASAHDLIVIEDAAHALPGTYRGRSVGTLGHMAAFSFYATKTIATGEGGMLVCDEDRYEARARVMSLHGMSKDSWKRYAVTGTWKYDVVAPGFKYNMTDLAAAMGLTQLSKCDRMGSRRTEIAKAYIAAFAQFSELETPASHSDVLHSWHIFLLRLNLEQLTIDRDRFIHELVMRGIGVSVHFIPVHTFTYYRDKYGYRDTMFPVAAREFRRSLSLPIYSTMSDSDVSDVIAITSDVVEKFRR
jgi:dTDP-4-amino-4,6-dideoxygalactose transaminase